MNAFHAPVSVCLLSGCNLVSCSRWAPASSIPESCLNTLSALCQNFSLISPERISSQTTSPSKFTPHCFSLFYSTYFLLWALTQTLRSSVTHQAADQTSWWRLWVYIYVWSPLQPPSLIVQNTPSAGQKGSYCVHALLRIDFSAFSREKNAHPLSPPCKRVRTGWRCNSTTLPPPHFTVGLMKQHWSLLSGCASRWESNCVHRRGGCGLCMRCGLVGPGFTGVAPRHMHAAHLCCRVGFSQDTEEIRFLWF